MDRWGFIRTVYGARIVGAVVVLSAVIVAGIIAYEVAASKGIDVDTAKVASLRAGQERGQAAAARHAYAREFKSARERAYRAAYRDAYEAAYRDQFEQAGLAAPEVVAVHGP